MEAGVRDYHVSASGKLLSGVSESISPNRPPPTLDRSEVTSRKDTPSQQGLSPIQQPPNSIASSNAFSRSAMTSSPQLPAVHAEFLRNLFRTSLDDFQAKMHEDVLNLHVDLLRQFELQKVGGTRGDS